jgi:hypothetical protein
MPTVELPTLVRDPCDERTERDELAVGEVRQSGGAVDEGQTDRADPHDRREHETVQERLRKDRPTALGLTDVLSEEEAAHLALRRVHLQLAFGR